MTYEQKLERENELLRLEVEYLKKLQLFRWIRRLSRKAQAALSFELKEKFKLKDVLHIVGIPESSYHYHIKMMKKENPDQELRRFNSIDLRRKYGNYGYRRIHWNLETRGFIVNHKKVQRLMKKLGLKEKIQKKNT